MRGLLQSNDTDIKPDSEYEAAGKTKLDTYDSIVTT